MNEKTDVHTFVCRATPAIQCARRFFHSYLKETKKINNQFLSKTSVFQTQLNAVAVSESLCLVFLYGEKCNAKERCGRFS